MNIEHFFPGNFDSFISAFRHFSFLIFLKLLKFFEGFCEE